MSITNYMFENVIVPICLLFPYGRDICDSVRGPYFSSDRDDYPYPEH